MAERQKKRRSVEKISSNERELTPEKRRSFLHYRSHRRANDENPIDDCVNSDESTERRAE